jgi:hypothetical protein
LKKLHSTKVVITNVIQTKFVRTYDIKKSVFRMVAYESVENGSRKKCRKLKTALHSIMPKLKNNFTPK